MKKTASMYISKKTQPGVILQTRVGSQTQGMVPTRTVFGMSLQA